MKNLLLLISVIMLMGISCCSGGDSSGGNSETTWLTITFGIAETDLSAGAVTGRGSTLPSNVDRLKVTVSAPDIITIVKEISVAGMSSVTVTVEVLNGFNRLVVVEALDGAGNIVYAGQVSVNLFGKPLSFTIDMSPVNPQPVSTCVLYVDMNAGTDNLNNCTDRDNPCKTISHSLTQTNGKEEICVEGGTYQNPESEGRIAPLALKFGTTLRCRGANHSTVINGGIVGADLAYITGCRISPSDPEVPAVDDNGSAITIDNCLIESSSLNAGGIYISADTKVINSTIRNFTVIRASASENSSAGMRGIHISSGSPVIMSNTITGNLYGLDILGGTPSVLNNMITDNDFGVYISGGDPALNGNTLSCNTFIDVFNNSVNTVNARNNSWDNSPPALTEGPCIERGQDIVGRVDHAGYSLAPSPCQADLRRCY